ncbi:unnamed protein product [Symbiodinium sp. CCMP2592]|nr:unnamed protein product [Symbiodinium sp. CCMP2592]
MSADESFSIAHAGKVSADAAGYQNEQGGVDGRDALEQSKPNLGIPGRRGHEDRVRAVDLSPDGETVASASDDGTVRLWDWEGDPMLPEGSVIASASDDGSAKAQRANPFGEGAWPLRQHTGAWGGQVQSYGRGLSLPLDELSRSCWSTFGMTRLDHLRLRTLCHGDSRRRRRSPSFSRQTGTHKASDRQWGFIPRLGRGGGLRRAPPRFCAFAEALRRSRCFPNPGSSLVGNEGSLLHRGALDCIEAQWQHAAEEWQFMRSHRDGASGLLQIGLSLRGRRYLSFGLHHSPEPPAGPDPSVWDEEAWQKLPAADLTTLALNPGDVYVATPAVFEHGSHSGVDVSAGAARHGGNKGPEPV